MDEEQRSRETYEKIRAAFAPVEPPSSWEELEPLIAAIFDGDGFWTNRGAQYLEYEYQDPAKPIKRFLEQRPAIFAATFFMAKEDFEDENLMKHVRCVLTKSGAVSDYYAMAWFFLTNFGLLARCRHGGSKEKVLRFLEIPQDEQPSSGLLPDGFRYCSFEEEFDLSPIVFCGALRPSEMLERACGRQSVVVFPCFKGGWSDDRKTYSATAYLLEFPNPIEPVNRACDLHIPETLWFSESRLEELGDSCDGAC